MNKKTLNIIGVCTLIGGIVLGAVGVNALLTEGNYGSTFTIVGMSGFVLGIAMLFVSFILKKIEQHKMNNIDDKVETLRS